MNRATFIASLKYAQEKAPEHPLLSTVKKKGFSKIGVIYLNQIIATIPEEKEEPKQEKKQPKELQPLFDQLNDLYIKRAKLSNQFRKMATVRDAAVNSLKIQDVQKEIGRKMAEIAYAKKYGEAPISLPEQKFDIPGNPIDCMKKLNSIKVMESRFKKKIQTLAQEGKSKAQIKEANDKLNHYTAYKEALKDILRIKYNI